MTQRARVVALVAGWAVLLFGVDWLARAEEPPAPPDDGAELEVRLPHLCQAGCVEAVMAAVLGLDASGLGDAFRRDADGRRVDAAAARPRPTIGGGDATVHFAVVDESRVDFVAIVSALRHAGFAPASLRYLRRGALTLRAELPHAVEETCSDAAALRAREHVLGEQRRSRGARYAWLRELRFDGGQARIVVHPDAGGVEILEAIAAIEAAGLTPRALLAAPGH